MKLFKHVITLGIIATSLVAIPAISQAQDTNQLTIINHFDKSLNFFIGRNPDVLPDLSEKFTVAPGAQISSRVVDVSHQAYIRAEDEQKDFVFWGVEINNNQVDVHGYLSDGVAYSWDNEKIVFCSPDEYKKKNSCL